MPKTIDVKDLSEEQLKALLFTSYRRLELNHQQKLQLRSQIESIEKLYGDKRVERLHQIDNWRKSNAHHQ